MKRFRFRELRLDFTFTKTWEVLASAIARHDFASGDSVLEIMRDGSRWVTSRRRRLRWGTGRWRLLGFA